MMTRLILVSVLSLMFVLPVLAQEGTTPVQSAPPANTGQPTPIIKPFDFRKTYWGMSMQEVRLSETFLPSFDKNETLGYRVIFANKKANLSYTFMANRLMLAGYVFDERYSDLDSGYIEYKRVKEYLETIYGKTNESDKPQDGIDPNVKYQAIWYTARSSIVEFISLQDKEFILQIIFHS